jgi:hypothetical protein
VGTGDQVLSWMLLVISRSDQVIIHPFFYVRQVFQFFCQGSSGHKIQPIVKVLNLR